MRCRVQSYHIVHLQFACYLRKIPENKDTTLKKDICIYDVI